MPVETMQVPRQTPRLPGAEDMVARHIAYLRKKKGWSNAELAKRMTDAGCPINQSAIQKIEHGDPRRTISLDEALALADVFGTTVEELMRPPEEVITVDLARFIKDARDLRSEVSQMVAKVRESFEDIAAASRDAGPLLEYLGLTGVELPTEQLQESLTATADLLLQIRDELAGHSIGVWSEAEKDAGQ
jgi:transcriptional regulator with XRE-family HTH domain